ncbi:hypothetical protein [Lysobacter antibioticus]|uniref:hypothetical protein n=1 Tax=Lysobacter antibioticus TaxID=84531 RepID=UPI00094F1698|nr:hypothetical protein [Lysobacter antibioticus]
MTRKRLQAILVALFSAGWLIPLALGVDIWLNFWQLEAWPLLSGVPRGNSFPFIDAAKDCLRWALLWLGAVIAFWSYRAFTATARTGAP